MTENFEFLSLVHKTQADVKAAVKNLDIFVEQLSEIPNGGELQMLLAKCSSLLTVQTTLIASLVNETMNTQDQLEELLKKHKSQ